MITLSQYTITGTIFEGEIDALYSGHRNADHAAVAVKVLRGEYPSPRDIARIRHEYGVLRSLSVPGVVQAYALERSATGVALVLERLPGRLLHDLLAEGRLAVTTALQIASAVAGVLAALHERRVIHKDISPRHLIVDLVDLDGPKVMLTDFGIATRLAHEAQSVESPAALEGTLAYMSPEQTGRMNRVVDARTDLYSLGVTLYEMLTGALPFSERDPGELVHAHIAKTPTRPTELVPEIPAVVADLVMKLLSKAAEDRYQSAEGLKADLDACVASLGQTGSVAPFPLGQRDRGRALRIPQKLYGRDEELAALMAAFERVSLGATELLLITGPAGVGKSALVDEVHRSIARAGGYFGAGAFEDLAQGNPYAPVTQALRGVVRQILTENAASVARWKLLFEEALGQAGRVVIELIPELAHCLDAQPSTPELASNEGFHQFNLALERLLGAIARERPLALFLDDLPRIDPASLALLELVLTNIDGAHLLVIGTYRHGEIAPTHPLHRTLGELRQAGLAVSELALSTLPLPSVAALLADTLTSDAAYIAPLARLTFEKTHGNPFFLSRFLEAIHRQGMLVFDPASAAWTWDEAQIAAAAITDNVVDFLLAKIKQLAPQTQRVLALAACVGQRFDLRVLSMVLEASKVSVAGDLWEALEEGLVLPLDAGYRFFDAAAGATTGARPAEPGGGTELEAPAVNVSYRFSHERVQQAAALLIGAEQKQEVHLRVGRLKRANRGEDVGGEQLLEIVTHLNLGAAKIQNPDELTALVQENLLAGKMAKARAAYDAAVSYFATGAALLDAAALDLRGAPAWETDYALAYALHTELGECEQLSGRLADADARYDELFRRAKTGLERSDIDGARVALYTAMGRFHEAIAVGREGLARLGVTLPATEEEAQRAFEREMTAVGQQLGKRRIDDLLRAKVATDGTHRATLKLLMELLLPTLLASPNLRNLITVRQVYLSLAHGHTESSCFGYMAYGVLLARGFGRLGDGEAFGRLALALHERLPCPDLTGNLNFMFGACAHLFEPLAAVVPYFERAYHQSLGSGNLARASYVAAFLIPLWMSMGSDLGELEAEVDKFIAVLRRRSRDDLGIAGLLLIKQVIKNLTGRTAGRHTLRSAEFDEAQFFAGVERPGSEYLACSYFAWSVQLGFLYEDFAGAIAMAAEAESRSASSRGIYILTELSFFAFLSYAALIDAAAPEDRPRYERELARYDEEVGRWAEYCPANYQHRHLLMRAEGARIERRDTEAMALYDQAIEAAQRANALRDEAVANEVTARFYLDRGRTRIARAYLSDAHHAYLRWGAVAKIDAMEEKAPESLMRPFAAGRSLPLPFGTAPISERRGDRLDVVAVVRAAQAIAGEILLDKVLDRLLRITLSNAGAQRGVLLLEQGGRLWLEATITAQPDRVRLGPRVTLEEASAELGVSIAQYVVRTSEPLVIGDALREARWSGDPYLVRAEARSILCLPMMHHGRLIGVLYLENNAVTDAFTTERIEVCQMLASQAAIAVENALLYEHVQTVTDELRQANDHLEQEVARRTEQLRLEFAERVRLEEGKAALQEQFIQAQHERMQEMSTPLVPISDRVMAMPLIGTIDAGRAEQMLETALHGASKNRAKIVIVDITGVKQVDAEVASTLLRTAGALKLIGAEVVVTGIRPEVAQTLVGLGVGLGAMVTLGTLESGIAYALRKMDGAGKGKRGTAVGRSSR